MESFNNQFATLKLRETEEVKEQNVTGGGEAYLPGLDVPEKKYKGPKESEVHDGYKKVKGFRAGHTKDTGGFQYKDLWNVNENEEVNFEEGDKAKVVKKGSPQDGKIGNVVSVNNNFYTLQFKDGQKVIFHSSDLKAPKSKEPMGPQKMLSLDENEEWPNEVPSRYREYIFKLVNVMPDRAKYDVIDVETGKKELGSRVYGSVKSLKYAAHDLIKPQGGRQSSQFETSGYGNYTRPETMLEENYSKFKKETKTRTNEQQLHSAMKLAEKKIKEANKILEYTSQLRGELNETKAGKHTQRVMERITKGIAEAYGKMKKLK